MVRSVSAIFVTLAPGGCPGPPAHVVPESALRAQACLRLAVHKVLLRETVSNSRRHYAPRSVSPEVRIDVRSEEHTSELQSRENLVCRLLLEKKKVQRLRRDQIRFGVH